MVLTSNVGQVASKPADGGTAPTSQGYYDVDNNTRITHNVMNELIEIFTQSLDLFSITNLPNDPLALRKCFEAVNANVTANTANITANATNIATNTASITALEADIADVKTSAPNNVKFGSSPDIVKGDLQTSSDNFGTPFSRIKSDGTKWSLSEETHKSVDNTSYSVTDAVGNVLFSVDAQGKFIADIAQGGVYGEPFYDFTDYIGISIEGQSNAFSIASGLIDTTLTNCFVADTGLKTLDINGDIVADTSAIEVFEGTSADLGDTAITNVAHGVGYWLGNSGIESANQSYFFQNSGKSGASIDDLSFGTTPFVSAGLKYGQAQTISNASYKDIFMNFVVWLQGESDAINGMTQDDYIARLLAYIQSRSQSYLGDEFIPFFSYQMGGHANYPVSNSYDVAIAHYKMRDVYPHYSCVAPTYMFPYVDGVHMDSHGLRNLGLYFGRAIDQFMQYKTFFKPLHPTRVKKQGSRGLLIDFYVPVEPIQFSTTTVSNLDDGHYGFEVWDDTGRRTITTSQIFSDNQVFLEVSADLVGDVYVNYAITPDSGDAGVTTNGAGDAYTDYVAGRTTGTRGCLCDSDTTSVDINDDDNQPYDMRNYCVIFREKAE